MTMKLENGLKSFEYDNLLWHKNQNETSYMLCWKYLLFWFLFSFFLFWNWMQFLWFFFLFDRKCRFDCLKACIHCKQQQPIFNDIFANRQILVDHQFNSLFSIEYRIRMDFAITIYVCVCMWARLCLYLCACMPVAIYLLNKQTK